MSLCAFKMIHNAFEQIRILFRPLLARWKEINSHGAKERIMLKNMGFFKRKLWAQRSDDRLKKIVDIALKKQKHPKISKKVVHKVPKFAERERERQTDRQTETQDIEHATLVHDYSKKKLMVDEFQWRVIQTGICGIFWNPSYGHPWTIPNIISKITVSFSSLTASFSS